MPRLAYLISFVIFASGFGERLHAATNAQISALGCLSVKQYGAMGDGTTDDTQAIRSCIAAAKTAGKAVLFPAGTYLVSDTLDCSTIRAWNGTRYLQEHYKVTQMIGSTRGVRPKILLKDSAPGFNNPGSPKVVLFAECRNENAGTDPGGVDIGGMFNVGFRNLEVEIGTGNSGAVGLYFPGSQSCFLEDFAIDMSNGGHAGISGLPGAQCSTSNIEIIGGKYGIIARQINQSMGYPSLSGIRLINQTDYALYYNSLPISLIGFEIEKASAPAIKTIGTSTIHYGNICLVDGSIKFGSTNGQAAIDNSTGVSFTMRNVYLQNASNIITSSGQSAVTGGSGWYKVDEYIYPRQGGIGLNLVNGANNTTVYVTKNASSAPPSDLRARHTWNEADYPSPDDIYDRIHDSGYAKYDPDSYAISSEEGVLSGSGNNCWNALQTAIYNHSTVLLTKGDYYIGQSLTLRDGTRFVGIGNAWSTIQPHGSWIATQQNYLNGQTAVITTVDNATADPMLAHVKVYFPMGSLANDWFVGIHWKAGRNSETRALWPRGDGGVADGPANSKANARISGGGGGQHWGGINLGTKYNNNGNVNFRQMLVEGTTEPLLFYNANPEDTGTGHGYEFKNCSNVAVYGMKGENQRGLYFNGSSNCAVFDFTCANAEVTFKNNCMNVYAAMVCPKFGQPGAPEKDGANNIITETYNSQTYTAGPLRGHTLGVFKRGSINWDNLYINPNPSGDATPPSAPTGVSAVAGKGKVDLNWNDNSESDLSDYRVWRSTSATSDGAVIVTVSQSIYTDEAVQGGSTYYYRISARDQSLNESPKSSQVSATPQPMDNLRIAYVTTPPVIDGIIDSCWGAAAPQTIDNIIAGAVSSGGDCSGSFKMLWDSSNLHVLVSVSDDILKNDSTKTHDDDTIEVYIDADNSKDVTYGADDFQYGFRWHASTPDSNEFKHGATSGVVWRLVSISGGYRLEGSIPWSTLLETPVAGNSVGIEVHVNDDDDGGSRDGKIAWFGTADTAWQNPSTFGTGNLVSDSSVKYSLFERYL